MKRFRGISVCLGLALALSSMARTHVSSAAPVLRIGAVYPLTGPQSGGAVEEFHGAQTAARLINQAGGVRGRQVMFDSADAPSADAAPSAIDSLSGRGIQVVMGSYGSTISLPASSEAQRKNLIFWESGAVATMITQRGYPNVFRTVTTGNSLGRAAARYVADVAAPKLRRRPQQLKTAVVYVQDTYGSSVGSAMIAEARALHFNLPPKGILPYNPYHVDFKSLVARLSSLHPDVVMVVSYVSDAITFRRETLRQGVRPAIMIGTSSSFCMRQFGVPLGRDAVGLFASDKPDASFNPAALRPAARSLLFRAQGAYRARYHTSMTAPAVAGFVSGWILLHDVLPKARSLRSADVRAAALSVDLPYGSEINGAGVRFAGPDAPDAGQNLRAISVIWQWQRPGHAAIVWPKNYANSTPIRIPLPGWHV